MLACVQAHHNNALSALYEAKRFLWTITSEYIKILQFSLQRGFQDAIIYYTTHNILLLVW